LTDFIVLADGNGAAQIAGGDAARDMTCHTQ